LHLRSQNCKISSFAAPTFHIGGRGRLCTQSENPTHLSGSNPRVGLSGRKVESAALQLLAALTPASHDVSIVQEHLGDDIRFNDPGVDLVGITAMTIQARRAYQIADGYRAAGKTVVLGGIHPSVLPNEALLHADAVVVGEAEHVWSQVLSDVASGHLRGIYRGQEYADLTQLPLCGAIFSPNGRLFPSARCRRRGVARMIAPSARPRCSRDASIASVPWRTSSQRSRRWEGASCFFSTTISSPMRRTAVPSSPSSRS